MRSVLLNLWVYVFLLMILVSSCYDQDDVGEFYTTFTEELMGGYLTDRPDKYSEFSRMLDTTRVLSLLNAYGKYTCFAPTNEAIYDYYRIKGKNSLSDFDLDTIKKIVYDHIIEDYVIMQEEFSEGRLGSLTMSDRYLTIGFDAGEKGLVVVVNQEVPVLELDNEVHNGVIHTIGKVINPTEYSLVETIAKDPKFKLFNSALIETKLYEQMTLNEDLSYDKNAIKGGYELYNTWRLGTYIDLPEKRKFGYTALIESDSVFAENGIFNIDDLKAYAKKVYDEIYPEDAHIEDVTDPRNSFNRFVAYHLINKQISASKFIKDIDNTLHSIKTYDMFDYIEPMCPGSLIEVRTHRSTNRTTLFNYLSETGKCIQLSDDNFDNDAINGVFHEIDGILTYNKSLISELSGKRLRYDAASFFPEITNNNMRGRGTQTGLRYILPYGYVDRLWTSEGTTLYYYLPDDRLADYQGDEIFLMGMYDFEMITPVVPKGAYEIRMGYQPNGGRGVAQLYWDGLPCGIPLDLRILATDAKVGFEAPGEDPSDPNGFENDKMMHNRGYMKGPASFRSNGDWYADSESSARNSITCLRRVLGIYTFDETTVHKFTVRAVREGQFQLDYLEFVPIEILEREGIE
ncbi:MAG: fasciclin domain-containing protein [Marinilabiliaceae bacterium]|nr:fasciclin domain-containing protein [Marinilabiliaceae bacterium]